MAASKAIGITPQRLWQARNIQILISEGEPIPIQVDGESWLQQPGCITIRFKNCIQMLSRDKFEKLLRELERKRNIEIQGVSKAALVVERAPVSKFDSKPPACSAGQASV